MIRHFKFVGGPWDGGYHEVDSEAFQRGYLNVAKLPPFEPIQDMEVELMVERTFEYTRYTLRHFAGPNEIGNVYYFANSEWSDFYSLSQLIHHYPGYPGYLGRS